MDSKTKTIGMLVIAAVLVLCLSNPARTAYTDEWWNISWNHRIMLVVNSTAYDRADWIIETGINFTGLLEQSGLSGALDNNSIRVVEYDLLGNASHEIPSQFDPGENYNASTNAFGTLLFAMNGTSTADTNRSFYVYYDLAENGAKSPGSYTSSLASSFDGRIASVNTSYFEAYIDTNRSQNTSGMYKINSIITVPTSQRTAEYAEYFGNGSNLTFDLRGNATITGGPLRVTLTQTGPEIEWGNISNQTGEATITKIYHFYNHTGLQQYGGWMFIRHELENAAGYDIDRQSTQAGAVAIDVERSFFGQAVSSITLNTTEPSYSYAIGDLGEFAGILNYNKTASAGFSASNTSESRIGVNLTNTTIQSGSTIFTQSLAYFGSSGGSSSTEFLDVVDRFRTPATVTFYPAEYLSIPGLASIDHAVYNKNETIILNINTSFAYDPYGLVTYVNATFDMGTSGTGDDTTIELFDDGSHSDAASGDELFGATFNISETYNTSQWNVTFTMYKSNNEPLNQSTILFNVTGLYSVTVTMLSQYHIVLEQVNASIHVSNLRNDTNITNSTGALNITCWYNQTQITDRNITNQGNGTYFFQFDGPATTGLFNLNCTAGQYNNTGEGLDTFFVEFPYTTVSINTTLAAYNSTSVTKKDNETLVINITLNNTGNASAQAVNITLSPPGGWSYSPAQHNCGNMNIHVICQKQFNLTVPNGTSPGSFFVNTSIEWVNTNSSYSTNITQFNVTVFSNPVINVSTVQISSDVGDGYEIRAGSFKAFSIGNDALNNVTLNVTGLDNFTFEFIPPNVSVIVVGNNTTVLMNVTVPLWYAPGTYNGTLNVSVQNSNIFSLINVSITVPATTSTFINTTQSKYIASNVTRLEGENFSLAVNVSNTGNATARYSNITLEVPAGWANSPTTYSCGNISTSTECLGQFNISIPNETTESSFYINATVEWFNPDTSTNSATVSNFNVTVLSNPVVTANVSSISIIVGDGGYNITNNFTIYSAGNDNISLLSFSVLGLGGFNFNITPANISNFTTGSIAQVFVNVSAQLHLAPGTYNGTINMSHEGGHSLINLSITVPINRSWSMDKTFCQRAENPDTGSACIVTVNNTGNTFLNFTISPQSANYTEVNLTNFSLLSGESIEINITYNVTGVAKLFYDTYYFVNATEADAIPGNMTLHISLIPFIEPIINVSISSQYIPQGESVDIYINVTDRSQTGINLTSINITTPDNISYEFNLTSISESGNLSMYMFTFPNVTGGGAFTNITGNSSTRGFYNITIFSKDSSPLHASSNETINFTAYASLVTNVDTVSDSYYQNSHGWITCNVTDFKKIPIPGVNVTLAISDPLGRVVYNSTYTTSGSGWLFPMPEFSIAADAEQGTYNLTSVIMYYDSVADYIAINTTDTVFDVTGAAVGGIEASVDTNVVWYPDNDMTLIISVYDANTYAPLEPDSLDLVVYTGSPLLKNVYLRSNLSDSRMQLSNFSVETNSSVGPYYVITYVMPPTTASGDYWARADATYGSFSTTEWESFKVTSGGPYDVEVTPLEAEVYREDFFDFEILVLNMGEIGQDVDIEYWVTDSSNSTWYYKNFTVFTPAGDNVTLVRNAYIWSMQPLGQHRIHVKVTYDSILLPIETSATFLVVETPSYRPPPEPTGPSAPTTIVDTGGDNISIIEYPVDISMVRGWEDIRHIKVKNTGESLLENVTLSLLGVPSPWYSVNPRISRDLPPGNTTVFVISFSIPKNAMTGEYNISFVAAGDAVGDERDAKMRVFRSQAELVEDELERVKEEYAETVRETNLAEKYGKDVAEVKNILKEAKVHIDRAEAEFLDESYTEAISHINTAWELIRRAQEELGKSEYRPDMITRGIPLWMLVVLLIGFVAANVIIFLWRRKSFKRLDFREDLLRIRDVIRSVKREPPVPVEKRTAKAGEKRKLAKVLDLLESEMKEGLITEETYRELRKRTEKKLKKLK
jgi:uncharacterized membrane protein